MLTINQNRDITLDIARSISALWVVGIWHLFCYDKRLAIYDVVGTRLTFIFMACFMFVSGYLLSKYSFHFPKDVVVFYKKRLLRFYILYVLSAVTLYLGGFLTGNPMFISIKQLIFSLLGITTLFPPHPGTLWFISMIMLFYIITPIISYKSNSIIIKLLRSVIIYILLILWYNITGHIDTMVYVYYPVYVLGLVLPHVTIDLLKTKHSLSILGIISTGACIWVSLQTHSLVLKTIVLFLCVMAGVLTILMVSDWIAKINKISINKFFSFVAYSSLSAYLFHRHVYSILNTLTNRIGIDCNLLILWLVYLPIAIFVAFILQKVYDYSINIFFRKR